jgi:primosomal protein N' (replication factor Y)
LAQVLVDSPARSLDRAFTYAIPDSLAGRVQVGCYVLVPLGPRQAPGFVVGFTDTPPPPPVQVKRLYGLLLDEPLFDAPQVVLAEEIAARYVCSLAEALRLLLPPGAGRKVRRTVSLTPAGGLPEALAAVARAPRQQALLAHLQQTEGAVELERVVRELQAADRSVTVSSVESAVSGLQQRGLAVLTRELERPNVQPVQRQIASLVDSDEPWEEIIEELERRAPRQAEVIATLLLASDGSAAVAEFPRQAVAALEAKGLVRVELEVQQRTPEAEEWKGASVDPLRLNEAQRLAYETVKEALEAGENRELLLHGVTGSGKTEVYLHCVDLALRQNKTALVLVPEISLTPQMVGRFAARFGGQMALMHSGLSQGERFDEWYRVRRGEARIVIGARSAVFAPLADLGVIIVDEEHENAYKQDQPPRYQAVSVARRRAELAGAVLLLGSATPSVERYQEAQAEGGKLQLLELQQRVDDRPLPEMRLVDLREERLVGRGRTFSQPLLDAIGERLAADEQVMLFLNRRGFSTFVMCRECGYALRCPDCDISLTYHHQAHAMRCHHCDYAHHVPDQCPNCQGFDVGFEGLGTERVADQVEREFPAARVARMDRDTIGHKGAYGQILRSFAAGETNVLVGTQMIAKGHDFPGVTLVGVLNADTGLHRPDFRAAEHTFQVLTQVGGRAGRADKPGEVVVQTFNPEHYAILTASRHDYGLFYQRELERREKDGYPPFTHLARLVFAAEEENKALLGAKHWAAVLESLGVCNKEGDPHYLGPAPAPLRKLRGKYRYSMLIKAQAESLAPVVAEALRVAKVEKTVAVTVDIDPVDMM